MDVRPLATAPAVRTTADAAGLGTLLGVWAHPDDDVYLSAGLMAAAAAAGHRVVVISATRGEAGTPDPRRWPPERLARRRALELAAGLAELDGGGGHIEHRFLGDRSDPPRRHLDGTLATEDPDRVARAVAELAETIIQVAPDTVLTFGPDGMTGHADHRAVSAWVDEAFRLAAPSGAQLLHATLTADVVQPFEDLLDPMDDGPDVPPICAPSELVVDLTLDAADLDRKVAALRAHASQTSGLERQIGTERFRRFVAAEQFRRADAMPGNTAASGVRR